MIQSDGFLLKLSFYSKESILGGKGYVSFDIPANKNLEGDAIKDKLYSLLELNTETPKNIRLKVPI